ncbi:MAG: NTP transferase domain-containing protein, partial [Paracoccaceae bacterium]
MSIAVVILAAGKGTRMVSDLPKALHKVAHAPLLTHAMRASACLEPEKTVIVVGHEAEQVAAAAREIDETALIAEQKDQLGTGHAVSMAKEALSGFDGDILVLYADTPFISEETMQAIKLARNTSDL